MADQYSNKVVAYYRVSTKGQGQSGLGQGAQEESIKNYVSANDCELLGEYTEVMSGKRADRPKLKEAIQHAKLARATLVVAKLDRLSRNVAFFSALMESEVDFVICDIPHANKLTIHILVAVAEYEALLASKRTKDSLAIAKSRGVKLGSSRPGHWEGIEHKRGWKQAAKRSAELRSQRAAEDNAELASQIQEMRDRKMTFEDIAQEFTKRGYQTTTGKTYTARNVARIYRTFGPAKTAG